LRWFVRSWWRREELCLRRGGNGSVIENCPDAPNEIDRCAECPLIEFELRERGEFGALLRGACEWRSLAMDGFAFRLDEIPADEALTLRLLREEEPPPKQNGEHSSTRADGR
jgi:hypothetical protein